MIQGIAQGVVAGAIYGIGKYWNKKQKAKVDGRAFEMEFHPWKFIKTLLIGGIIGGVAVYFNLSVEMAYANEMLYFGSVVAVEEILKPAKRYLNKKGWI